MTEKARVFKYFVHVKFTILGLLFPVCTLIVDCGIFYNIKAAFAMV